MMGNRIAPEANVQVNSYLPGMTSMQNNNTGAIETWRKKENLNNYISRSLCKSC